MSKEEILEEYLKLSEDEEKILQKMRKVHKADPYTVPNVVNKKSEICFVFSCPGRDELIAGKPCQGATGDNLKTLLCILKDKRPDLFKSQQKDDYDILNTTTIVHFSGLDNKTEGNKKEILKEEKGIKEYVEINKSLKYAILFGCKAKSLKAVFGSNKVIESIHLGYQSINQIGKDIDGNEISVDTVAKAKDRTHKRLEYIAEDILKQIENITPTQAV